MTVKREWSLLVGARAALTQLLIVILINVPTVSFGLALGWVSLASGEAGAQDTGGAGGEEAGRGAVVAAVTTFTASLVGVPLSARALVAGRKVALIGTSACFVVDMLVLEVGESLGRQLVHHSGSHSCGAGWSCGLGSLASASKRVKYNNEEYLMEWFQMCSERFRGAAVSALAVAHNLGLLLMYVAADVALSHRTVLWSCLGLAVLHCVVFAFVPESPSFLAANGKAKEARASLAWFRGRSPHDPALEAELAALPPPEDDQSSWNLAKKMLSDPQRRRAFVIGAVAVVGQEACGVLAILQYAERVFVLARDGADSQVEATMSTHTDNPDNSTIILAEMMGSLSYDIAQTAELVTPARHAVLLGAVQLVMSMLSLYLVEQVGRRPLIVWCATATGAALAVAAWLVHNTTGAAVAIAVAIAADSAGLQPAPYALLADMFHYQYRSCALMLVTAGACAGNAMEVALFPAAVAAGGLRAALALGASLTLAYAIFAFMIVPETRGKTPEQIYDTICPILEGESGECERGDSDTVRKDCGTNSESTKRVFTTL